MKYAQKQFSRSPARSQKQHLVASYVAKAAFGVQDQRTLIKRVVVRSIPDVHTMAARPDDFRALHGICGLRPYDTSFASEAESRPLVSSTDVGESLVLEFETDCVDTLSALTRESSNGSQRSRVDRSPLVTCAMER